MSTVTVTLTAGEVMLLRTALATQMRALAPLFGDVDTSPLADAARTQRQQAFHLSARLAEAEYRAASEAAGVPL